MPSAFAPGETWIQSKDDNTFLFSGVNQAMSGKFQADTTGYFYSGEPAHEIGTGFDLQADL
jgi:hypothetical protein